MAFLVGIEERGVLLGLGGVSDVVVNREVVEGRAKPLYIYADQRGNVTA